MSASISAPEHIFRQYDIRGLVDAELTPEVCEGVGRGYATMAYQQLGRVPRVAVGQDNRPSSPALASGLIRGLNASGADVVDIGTVPTPSLYWAEQTLPTDGGIQITGSHNPPEWNGIKMTLQAMSVYGDRIQAIKHTIGTGEFREGAGTSEPVDLLDRYVEDLAGRFDLARPVKIVLDCGNGVGSLVGVELLEALGAEVVPLFVLPRDKGNCPQIVFLHRIDRNVAVHRSVAIRLGGIKFFRNRSRPGEFPPPRPRFWESLVFLVD